MKEITKSLNANITHLCSDATYKKLYKEKSNIYQLRIVIKVRNMLHQLLSVESEKLTQSEKTKNLIQYFNTMNQMLKSEQDQEKVLELEKLT